MGEVESIVNQLKIRYNNKEILFFNILVKLLLVN